jgi:hypothetical protein
VRDDDTRDVIMELTREVARLSTLVERNLRDDSDKEGRIRKLERYMYALPLTAFMAVASLFTSVVHGSGK